MHKIQPKNKLQKVELYKGRPMKSLTKGKKNTGGRNNYGRVTSARKGGGVKRLLRMVDFERHKMWDMPGEVVRFEYNPGASAHLALIKYQDKVHKYIIAPKGLKVGDTIIASEAAEPKVGNAMRLKSIPQGFSIHNVELYPNNGAKIARAAGSYAKVLGRNGDRIQLEMRSKEIREFSQDCIATIGIVGNEGHFNRVLGKAGASRWLNIRPSVRGIAKNPCDHAMGGRTDGGKRKETWDGKPTLGMKTRNPKKPYSNFIIRRRARNV